MDFLDTLIVLSEKAARLARLIRKDENLFRLLVEQKNQEDANPRFVDDFKTLADVLIQEMIKHFLELKYPGIASRVRGEENNTFCNTLGDKITVEVKETHQETTDLLTKVLNGNEIAASLMAEEVHKTVEMKEVNTKLPYFPLHVNLDEIGIWIDPIDSTAEYINASSENTNTNEESGLNCVTILIGVYNINTGEPIIGVINQPFHSFSENRWSGECIWGVCHNLVRMSSIVVPKKKCQCVYVSSSEHPNVKAYLINKGYEIKEAPGAGNKLLKVIKGESDMYVLSKATTFKWDTCGPQAILRSLGGNICNFSMAITCCRSVIVNYPHDIDSKKGSCNEGGILAYRLTEVLKDFDM